MAGSAAAAVGAAIGTIIGTPLPVARSIVGAALGSLASTLLIILWDVIMPDCDRPLAAAAYTILGSELSARFAARQEFDHVDNNPGIDSPHGCGANSHYHTTWSVRPAN
jgi:hypothetical protein